MGDLLLRRRMMMEETVPSNYVRLEYIESFGNEYINTLFNPNNDTSVEIDIRSKADANIRFFASYGSATGLYYGCGFSNSRFFVNQYETQNTITDKPSDLLRHKVRKEKTKLFVDDVLINDNNEGLFNNNYPLFLFAANNYGSVTLLSALFVYGCKIFDDGVLARNFIPAKRTADDVCGLWDTVTKTFFTNAGTGAFTGQ